MTETANAEMREYWNGAVGERWAAFQPVLDKSLQAISDAALSFAAARPGERVLDVGCGTGTTTYAFAKAVGPGGSVTGIDISRPMLAAARARGTESISAKAMRRPSCFTPPTIWCFRASA